MNDTYKYGLFVSTYAINQCRLIKIILSSSELNIKATGSQIPGQGLT